MKTVCAFENDLENWGGDSRSYSSPKTMAKDSRERIRYIRKASNSVEPSDDEEKDLFYLANRVPFDDRVNHQAEMSDLNITLIQNYLREVKSSLYEKSRTGDFLEVCSDMNIISSLPEYIRPKNVGLLFFSMESDRFFNFPYAAVEEALSNAVYHNTVHMMSGSR